MMFDDNRRVLVIDDNRAIHEDFRKILRGPNFDAATLDQQSEMLFGETRPTPLPQCKVDSAYQGEEGLTRIRTAVQDGRPYSVAFVDVRMPPGWDGVETMERIARVDPDIQFVLCTAYSDYTVEEIVDRMGQSDRLLLLRKPFDVSEAVLLAITLSEKWHISKEVKKLIQSQSQHIVDVKRVMAQIQESSDELKQKNVVLKEQSRRLNQQVQEHAVAISGTRDVTVFALARLAESRDPETGAHLERMRAYSQILAEFLAHTGLYTPEIDKAFLENFYQSTPLHDIGKVGIPDKILLKPGPLTVSEFEIMKRHTLIGASALEEAARQSECGSFLNMAANIARCHHERFDGTGYPIGLVGLQIPLAARIVAVADVFDSLTSARVYKEAISTKDARAKIEAERGRHFDPVVLDAFVASFDELEMTKAGIDDGSSENRSPGAFDEDCHLVGN